MRDDTRLHLRRRSRQTFHSTSSEQVRIECVSIVLAKSDGLLVTGIAGLAGYLYLDQTTKPVAPKKVQEKSPLDPDNFVDFKLKKVEPYNHNTAKYIFELPNNDASLLPIASCVIVKSASDAPEQFLDAKGKPVIRPYTPISPSDLEGELTFLIKRYEEGRMSQYIHALKVGDKLAIKGPIVKIPWKGEFSLSDFSHCDRLLTCI